MTLDEMFRQLIREEIVKALSEQVTSPLQAEFKPTVVPQEVPSPTLQTAPPPVLQPMPPVPQTISAVPQTISAVPQTPSISLDQIKAMANDFHRAQPHRAAEIIAILAGVGAQKMDEIPEAQYAKVYSEIQTLVGVQ